MCARPTVDLPVYPAHGGVRAIAADRTGRRVDGMPVLSTLHDPRRWQALPIYQ